MRRFRSRRFAMLLILMLTLSMTLQGLGTVSFAEPETEVQLQESPVEIQVYLPGDGSSAKIVNPPYTAGNYNTPPKYDVSGGTSDGTDYTLSVGSGTVYFKFSDSKKRVEWWSSDVYVDKAIVKGGDGYFTYNYSGMNALNDQGLRAPNNNGGNIPTISHICFVGGNSVPLKGSLEITKIINSSDVKTMDVSTDFVVSVTGPSSYAASHTFTSNNEKWLLDNLTPGDYTITEADLPDWTENVPASAVTVVANQKATATVTNTYNPPLPGMGSLEVTKIIDYGDFGETTLPYNFIVTIIGPSYMEGDSHEFTFNGEKYTWGGLIPGAYTITENNSVEWIENVPASAVGVAADQKAQATVTNIFDPADPELGTITINKTFIGGSVTTATFTLFDGGEVVAGPTSTDENGQIVFRNLVLEKTYKLVEDSIINYISSIGTGIDIFVGSNVMNPIQSVTNTYNPPEEPNEPDNPSEPGGGGTTTTTTVDRDRADPPSTTIPSEPTPLAAPVVAPVVLPEEIIPLGVPALPKTGELPVELLYGLGGMITAMGALLKRK